MDKFSKFKRFAAETKLHGIPRFAEGSKISIAFWAVLFAICVCMAITDLYKLVTYYQSEPTTIQMSLVPLPEDFNWTTPTLCMDMIADYFANDPLLMPGLLLSDDVASSSLNRMAAVANILAVLNTTFTSDNYTNVSFNDTIAGSATNMMYYSYMMLGYLIEAEQKLMGHSPLPNYQLMFGQADTQIEKLAQVFYDTYNQYNVSMAQLTQLVGMWYCLQHINADKNTGNGRFSQQIYGHMENYRYFGDPIYKSLPMCKANMITHLGFGVVCSKVFETPYVPFEPDYNQFVIYDTSTTIPPYMLDTTTGLVNTIYATMFPNMQFHLDLQGRNVIPADDKTNIFSWSPGDNVVLDISVSAEYQFLNTRIQSCSSSYVSEYDCKWQKQVEFVHQECGCWPSLADIQHQKNGLNCSVNPTNPLLNSIYDISTKQFCPSLESFKADLSDCIPECHQFKYAFTQRPPSIFAANNLRTHTLGHATHSPGSFEFRFNPAPHNYIGEYPMTNWNNFLGTWGGSIGTWLGASLLAFVHIPVYLFRQYCLTKYEPKAVE